ncbi:hypothetical protein CRG98_045127 [Punica granatum]|uniref:Uncharacterized protein n=1 Tax=Punica granatum TaxID=22663 RepID=A0A2I0HSA8_PUNGR|nr:hypothetical protein CRG98_045127 [Punica granatum]
MRHERGGMRYERGGLANLRCRRASSQSIADPARLQGARSRWLGELAVQESNLAWVSRPSKTQQGCKRHERGGLATLRCRKISSNRLADPARLHEARARWLGELAVQEIRLARVGRPSKVARGTSEVARRIAVQESKLGQASRPGKIARGMSEVARRTYGARKKVYSDGLADLARLQEARARWLGELCCRKVNSDGLADPAWLQEARARWLVELMVQERKSHGLAYPARLQGARARWLGELRWREVNSDGLADPARLQEARARWHGELAVQESHLARVSRPGKVQRGTSETRQGSTRHERGGSANLRCKKATSHVLADPARFNEARARWFGELAVQESHLARVSRPGKVQRGTSETRQGSTRHERGGSANLRCKKATSHVLADPARFNEARARWFGELAVQESHLARVSRPGKVQRGTSETRQGSTRHERGGSANLRCKKATSHVLADPARFNEARARWFGELAVQESHLARVSRPGKVQRGTSETRQGSTRHERGGSANLRCKKATSHVLADPARFNEARARWFGELAVQESHLARVSRPGKVQRGTSETRQGSTRHERGGSANLRCKKATSHVLADPARFNEARARWFGELAVQESHLARVSRPGKVQRGTSETRQGSTRHERGGSANLRCKKATSHVLADPARFNEARARWFGELAVQESHLARVSRPGKVQRGTSETRQGSTRHERGGSANLRCKKATSHVLADPARFNEARARWFGELAVQESHLARVSRPGKVQRGTSETRQGSTRHERGGSANLRCKKATSHVLADPARFNEARARWFGELAVQESHLARVSRPGKVQRGTSEGCKWNEGGELAVQESKLARVSRPRKVAGGTSEARLREARTRWLGELAVQESKLALISRPGKVARGTSEVARRTCDPGKGSRTD